MQVVRKLILIAAQDAVDLFETVELVSVGNGAGVIEAFWRAAPGFPPPAGGVRSTGAGRIGCGSRY